MTAEKRYQVNPELTSEQQIAQFQFSLLRLYNQTSGFTPEERVALDQRLGAKSNVLQVSDILNWDGEDREKLFEGATTDQLEQIHEQAYGLYDVKETAGMYMEIDRMQAYVQGRMDSMRDQKEQQRLEQEARQERISDKVIELKLTERETVVANTLVTATIDNPITSYRISRIASATMDDHFGRGDITNIFQRLRPKLEEEGLILLKRTSKEEGKTGYFLVELDPKVNQ